MPTKITPQLFPVWQQPSNFFIGKLASYQIFFAKPEIFLANCNCLIRSWQLFVEERKTSFRETIKDELQDQKRSDKVRKILRKVQNSMQRLFSFGFDRTKLYF